MDLQEGERVLKVFHHHITPFLFWLLEIVIVFFVCFFSLFLLQNAIPFVVFIIAHGVLIFLFSAIVLYKSFIFWLDKLIISNQRVIYVNWVSLFKRQESEAMLNDIQDIQTSEKGIISYISFFDYGSFTLETASAKTTITFDIAPDPEGIRQYIYHVRAQ